MLNALRCRLFHRRQHQPGSPITFHGNWASHTTRCDACGTTLRHWFHWASMM